MKSINVNLRIEYFINGWFGVTEKWSGKAEKKYSDVPLDNCCRWDSFTAELFRNHLVFLHVKQRSDALTTPIAVVVGKGQRIYPPLPSRLCLALLTHCKYWLAKAEQLRVC